MIVKRIILFIGILCLWFLLSWHINFEHVISGLIVSFIVVLLTGGIFSEQPFEFKGISRVFKFFFHLVPVFIWECARANIEMAYLVLHPRIPIKPGIVRVKMELKNRIGITFLANCITLTPGTLVIDVDSKNGYMYVHWMRVKTQNLEEATALIVGRFEKIIKDIFE